MIHRMLLLISLSLCFRETSNIYDTEMYMIQKYDTARGGGIKQNQNQGNFGFVCRVVTLSLNNSPHCNVKFLLDVLGVAFMV